MTARTHFYNVNNYFYIYFHVIRPTVPTIHAMHMSRQFSQWIAPSQQDFPMAEAMMNYYHKCFPDSPCLSQYFTPPLHCSQIEVKHLNIPVDMNNQLCIQAITSFNIIHLMRTHTFTAHIQSAKSRGLFPSTNGSRLECARCDRNYHRETLSEQRVQS